MAEELTREGAEVAICARTARDLEKVGERSPSFGGRKECWLPVDLGVTTGVARFGEAVEQQFAGGDICVTNPGGPPSNLCGPPRMRIRERGPTND